MLGTASSDSSHDAVDGAAVGGGARAPHNAVVLVVFLVVAVVLTFPNVTRLHTYIPGDSGDSLLNLWIIRRVQIGLPHGWHAFWDAPVFHPARGTMAYSDPLLPVALAHWLLRLLFGDVLALNLVYLGSWVLSSWCVYRLAMRFVHHWGAAFVAALAYTYAAVRLVHQQHLQLVVGGALVPLVLLLLLRVFDEPTIGRGSLLGLGFVAVALSASYFGAMTAVMIVVIASGLLASSRAPRRRTLVALAAAAGVVVVLVAPIAAKYWQLQRHPEFRREFESANATHLSDFAATGEHAYLLDHLPVLPHASRASSRSIERRLFPGLVATGLGAVGIAAVACSLRRRRRVGRATPDRRTQEVALVAAAGVAVLVLSFGDWFRIGGRRVPLPFAALRNAVPGFAGIRALSRLETGFQLALVLLAAVGLDTVLRRIAAPWRVAVAVALAGFVVAECAVSLVFVKVPTSADDGGVDLALRARPVGVVLELPIISSGRGGVWPSVEAPRQLLALRDHDPRVNGYSGFQPENFDRDATVLDHFPAADALGLARRLGVRYVVLRTRLVGELSPSTAIPSVDRNGVGYYDPPTAARMLDGIPPGAALAPVRLAGGYLVELKPG